VKLYENQDKPGAKSLIQERERLDKEINKLKAKERLTPAEHAREVDLSRLSDNWWYKLSQHQ